MQKKFPAKEVPVAMQMIAGVPAPRHFPGESAELTGVVSRVTAEEFEKHSGAQLQAMIAERYPEYDANLARAYLNGASFAAQMMGMLPDAVNHFIGAWARQDEWMLVGSLYSSAESKSEQFAASLVKS